MKQRQLNVGCYYLVSRPAIHPVYQNTEILLDLFQFSSLNLWWICMFFVDFAIFGDMPMLKTKNAHHNKYRLTQLET